MSDKKAFVFDTNFIVQNKKLTDVIDKLKDSYNLYVTQLSIDERIAQQVRERNVVYDEAEKLQQENLNLLSVHFKKSKDEIKEYVKNGVQRIYSEAFGDTIIEYSTTADSFKRVIQRANDKLPPFSNDKNASDKGFKDSILWFSILDYFLPLLQHTADIKRSLLLQHCPVSLEQLKVPPCAGLHDAPGKDLGDVRRTDPAVVDVPYFLIRRKSRG